MNENPPPVLSHLSVSEVAALKLLLDFESYIPTVSESNKREHWTVSSKRHKMQQWMVKLAWPKNAQISLPCYVLLERRSPRRLDSDNLAMAFKWIRDQIADLIIPDKASGQADADPRIEWIYRQKQDRRQSIRVTIWG